MSQCTSGIVKEAETITRTAIELAKTGDTTALRLCLERICPPRRDRPVAFTMPAIESIADVVKASTGGLTPKPPLATGPRRPARGPASKSRATLRTPSPQRRRSHSGR